MNEITEDLLDVVLGMILVSVLLLLTMQLLVAGFILFMLEFSVAGFGVAIIGLWVFLVTHGLLSDGKPRRALQKIGMFQDSEPIVEKEKALWSEN